MRAPDGGTHYTLDGIGVDQLRSSWSDRLATIPYALTYYALQDRAVDRLSDQLLPRLTDLANGAGLVHNVRIGRPPLSTASFKLARRRRVPFVFTPLHHPRWVGWPYGPYLDLYRQADGVIALTETEKTTLTQLGVDKYKIWVTGIGPILADTAASDGARFRARHHLGDDPMILFLGQKYDYKGVGALLEATRTVWRTHPRARFVFVGPRTTFSERAFAGSLDRRIVEVGSVSLEDKTDALAACDVLCVPSTQESFGGVYTEAWQLGKPVIGGPAPAIREVIDEGVDGYCVEQNATAISRAVVGLLSEPALRTTMGDHGRTKVEQRFTWARIAERTMECYRSVLGD